MNDYLSNEVITAIKRGLNSDYDNGYQRGFEDGAMKLAKEMTEGLSGHELIKNIEELVAKNTKEIRRQTIDEFKNLLLVKYDDYIFTDEEKSVLPLKDQELISAQNRAWKTAKKKAEQIAEQMKGENDA